MILSHAAGLAIVGTVVGGAGASALSKYVAGSLYGVPTHDPGAYLVVCACLIVVAVAAAYLPARRAMGVEPLSVLPRE
jgi:putative ABC transport system permease protein